MSRNEHSQLSLQENKRDTELMDTRPNEPSLNVSNASAKLLHSEYGHLNEQQDLNASRQALLKNSGGM